MPQEERKYTEEMMDGRRRLTSSQKEAIKERYSLGGVSWKNLANEYGVSKSTIGIIVNDKRREAVKARIKKHWRDYYNTEKHTDGVRKYRAKKRKLGFLRKKAACSS